MPDAMVAQVRRFNRIVTERVGALSESYLGSRRPLGEARLLWEIGDDGCEVRLLRARLGLDSGYTSRQIVLVDPDHPDARHCLAEYTAELNHRSDRGFDPARGVTALPHEVRPPAGAFFVAYLHGEPIGCGAVKHHDDAPAELKRMWIAPAARGLGLGRRLLATLEGCAADAGARMAHIETSSVLHEALALYRATGWVEVAPFNAEPFADHWFEKRLVPARATA